MCLIPEQQLVDSATYLAAHTQRSVASIGRHWLCVEQRDCLIIAGGGSTQLASVVSILIAQREEYPLAGRYRLIRSKRLALHADREVTSSVGSYIQLGRTLTMTQDCSLAVELDPHIRREVLSCEHNRSLSSGSCIRSVVQAQGGLMVDRSTVEHTRHAEVSLLGQFALQEVVIVCDA